MKTQLESQTILIEVEENKISQKDLKALRYQADLAILWFSSFLIALTTKCGKSSSGIYYNEITKLPSGKYIAHPNFNTLLNSFEIILKHTELLNNDTRMALSNCYGAIASSVISKIAPVQGFTLSCGECTIGTFYGSINQIPDTGQLLPDNVKAKILATYIILISYARALVSTSFCLMHTTMVKTGSAYNFYYEILAKYGLALSEIQFVNTNTHNVLSSVTYLTHDVIDKICNQDLDLEELFLLPDFKNYKDSSSYLFKDLTHIVDYSKIK